MSTETTETTDTAAHHMSDARSRLQSTRRQSNTGWHATGQPYWWARADGPSGAEFLEIPRTRGDHDLDCVVDVLPGTLVTIGAGKIDQGRAKGKAVPQLVYTTAIRIDVSE
jgi:hypothetical protein